jgi:hypothetical protein
MTSRRRDVGSAFVSDMAALIAARFETWGFVPLIVRDVYAESRPEAIASALDQFCLLHLGSGAERAEFFEASVGSVHGIELSDGRRVVVKAHRSNTSVAFLTAMQTVQAHLASYAFPTPEPLLGPNRLGRGVAIVESLLDSGAHADAHDPAIRSIMAHGLAALVARCCSLTRLDGLHERLMAVPRNELWPTPHDRRFDFSATTRGAEWIDRVASAAKRIRDQPCPCRRVVGHADWRVEHLRFVGHEISAVYDWDSICVEREPVLVGSVAHAFTANWTMSGWRQFPTLDEALAFAAEYEEAREVPFTHMEWRALRAALVYTMAYTARCEHSDALTDFGRRSPRCDRPSPVPSGCARAFLAAHVGELLENDLPDSTGEH